MVWFSPLPIRFLGRSADKMIIGTQLRLASMIDGKKFAAAVPEVDIITTGLFLDFERPSAKKAEERSSTWL